MNTWLLYKRDCETHSFTKNEVDDLLTFKSDIASILYMKNKNPLPVKRGRPSGDRIQQVFEIKMKRGPTKPIPPAVVRRN